MASRDPDDLYPPLRERWFWLKEEFQKRYPFAPEPRLSATYRDLNEQRRLFLAHKTRARPGQSLHNFTPHAYAFDVFFNDDKDTPEDKSDDVADWDMVNFKRFGEIAESIGLEWGGRWPRIVDGPHMQMPMTWKDAEAGQIPDLPPLPEVTEAPEDYKLVVLVEGSERLVVPFSADNAIVTRMSADRKRYWIDVKANV